MADPFSDQLDPQRWSVWYSEQGPRLKAFLFSVLRDRHRADEALQATFAKALTHGGAVQAGSEQSWLFQVAFHEALQIKRRAQMEQRNHPQVAGARSRESTPAAEEDLLQKELVQQVRVALDQLPVEQQEVVRRRIYLEQTFQQIAEELKVPLGTVLTRMRLALRKLQQILKPSL